MRYHIHDYIQRFDLDYTSIISPYIGNIIDNFLIQNKTNPNQREVILPLDHPICEIMQPPLEEIVETHFWVGPKIGRYGFRAYIQNNQISTMALHTHIHIPGAISGVFYYNVPKEGGELLFKYLEGEKWKNEGGFEKKVKVKENKIYLFPMWLPHTPLPQNDSEYRICFNWAYPSNIRAVDKLTNKQW